MQGNTYLYSFARGLLALLLGGCATMRGDAPGHGGRYSARMEGQTITLSCPDAGVVDVPCYLDIDAGGKLPVSFSSEPSAYVFLFGEAVQRATTGAGPRHDLQSSDAQLLKVMTWDRCHPAKASAHVSGDLVQLCLPKDPAAVVMFFRGLCDRCEFRPVVLRSRKG